MSKAPRNALAFLLWVMILQTAVSSKLRNFYCEMNCAPNGKVPDFQEPPFPQIHTACKQQPCTLKKECGSARKVLRNTFNHRKWIVNYHNELRNRVASGIDTVVIAGPNTVADMEVLNYDMELEFLAYCHLSECLASGPTDHCPKTSRYEMLVLQNYIYYEAQQGEQPRYNSKHFIEKLIDVWYSELLQIPYPDMFDHFPTRVELEEVHNLQLIESSRRQYGVTSYTNVTNMLFAKIRRVGCGRIIFSNKSKPRYAMHCNYAPGVIEEGKSIFRRGPPCSACPSQVCSQLYPALCGLYIDVRLHDDFVAPFKIVNAVSSPKRFKSNKLRTILAAMLTFLGRTRFD